VKAADLRVLTLATRATGIYEVMTLTRELHQLIVKRVPAEDGMPRQWLAASQA
jgi:hypothetical protein